MVHKILRGSGFRRHSDLCSFKDQSSFGLKLMLASLSLLLPIDYICGQPMTEGFYSNSLIKTLISHGGVDALSPFDPAHMARHGLFSVLGRYGSALYHTAVPIATAAAAADRAGSVCVCLREKSRLALRWESTRLAREQRGDARIWRWRTCRA